MNRSEAVKQYLLELQERKKQAQGAPTGLDSLEMEGTIAQAPGKSAPSETPTASTDPSDERAQLEAQANRNPGKFSQVMAAMADSLGKTDRNSRGLYTDQDRARAQLQQMDARSKQEKQEAWASEQQERQRGDWAMADAEQAMGSNIESDESKMIQQLASKMMPGKDFSKIPASKLKQLLPSLEKMYALDMQKQAKAGSGGSKAPPGYRFLPNGSLEAIPGGPAAHKLQVTDEKAEQRKTENNRAYQTVVQDLGRGMEILNKSRSPVAGPGHGMLKHIPLVDNDTKKLDALLESVKSNIGIDRLQAMRDSSPTGGALGQVPFQQQQRLEQLLGSLNVTDNQAMLEDNMKRVFNLYNDLIHGEGHGPERLGVSFDEQGRPLNKTKGRPSSRVNSVDRALSQPQQASGGFPRTVTNPSTGVAAEVSNEDELREAQAEGFQ